MISLYALNYMRVTDKQVRDFYGNVGDDKAGVFEMTTVIDPMSDTGETKTLRIIASNDAGWDHVSVSLFDRCPTWDEMEMVKRLFFKPDETAMQLHVPPTDHINRHPYCLHLWRPHVGSIPRPPAEFVG